VRGSWDQAADPKPFAAVNSKKIGKKYVVRDGEFSVELPEPPKIEKPEHKPGAPFETMTATIEHASTLVIFSVIEEQPFDALRRTPRQLELQAKDDLDAMAKVLVGEHPKMERVTATMGGLPAIQLRARGKKTVLTESWFAWDRLQHRMYVLTCTRVACAPIAKSLKLVPPQPTR